MRERSAILTHRDGLRFDAVTGTGRRIVFGDDEDANEHSPVELVAAALAACTAMDVVSILAKKRQVIESYSVRVEAAQRDEYPQVLTRIRLVHEVAGPGVTERDVRRSIELSARSPCLPSPSFLPSPTFRMERLLKRRHAAETSPRTIWSGFTDATPSSR